MQQAAEAADAIDLDLEVAEAAEGQVDVELSWPCARCGLDWWDTEEASWWVPGVASTWVYCTGCQHDYCAACYEAVGCDFIWMFRYWSSPLGFLLETEDGDSDSFCSVGLCTSSCVGMVRVGEDGTLGE